MQEDERGPTAATIWSDGCNKIRETLEAYLYLHILLYTLGQFISTDVIICNLSSYSLLLKHSKHSSCHLLLHTQKVRLICSGPCVPQKIANK